MEIKRKKFWWSGLLAVVIVCIVSRGTAGKVRLEDKDSDSLAVFGSIETDSNSNVEDEAEADTSGQKEGVEEVKETGKYDNVVLQLYNNAVRIRSDFFSGNLEHGHENYVF